MCKPLHSEYNLTDAAGNVWTISQLCSALTYRAEFAQTLYYPTKIQLAKPALWRVNGAVKLWKREPLRFQCPIKHGLYSYWYLDNINLAYCDLTQLLERAK